MEIFREHYLAHERPYELVSYVHSSGTEDRLAVRLLVDGEEQEIEGVGNGPIAALVDAFQRSFGITIRIRDYHEHAMSADTNADRGRLRRGRRRRRDALGRRAPLEHRDGVAAGGDQRRQPGAGGAGGARSRDGGVRRRLGNAGQAGVAIASMNRFSIPAAGVWRASTSDIPSPLKRPSASQRSGSRLTA